MKANLSTLFRFGLMVLYLGIASATAANASDHQTVLYLQDDKTKKEKKQAEEKEIPEIKEKKAPVEQHYDRFDKKKKRVNRPVRC